jgi:hypothetical protein
MRRSTNAFRTVDRALETDAVHKRVVGSVPLRSGRRRYSALTLAICELRADYHVASAAEPVRIPRRKRPEERIEDSILTSYPAGNIDDMVTGPVGPVTKGGHRRLVRPP